MPSNAQKWINISSGTTGTYGTTGSVVKKLMGVTDATMKIMSKQQSPKIIGYVGPSPISAEVSQKAEGSMTLTASYEVLPTIFNGFFTAIDASTITSGAPYNYPYVAPSSSTQTSYPYSMEYGTSGVHYRTNGTLFTEFTIKGEAEGLWEMIVPFVAKEVMPASSGISSGVSETALNVIRMADTKLYMDAFSTATVGGTTWADSLINFELGYKQGTHTKSFAGSLKPSAWDKAASEVTLKFQVEMGSTGKALIDEMLGSTGAQVKRQIRIGATQGSSASVKTVNLDFAGHLEEPPTLYEDREGNIVGSFSWVGQYSTGLGNYFMANVQNGSSSTT